MQVKKEARQGSDPGRATCDRHSYRIPQEEFERGSAVFGAAWLLGWCLLWSVETGLIAWPW